MPEINKPIFSIITPTNKRTLLLKRTIYSVINQTFKDYEHIIIDDANDLETNILINSIENKRIIFYQHQNPKGAAGAYNSGIRISRGKFILFLDDDDEYLPTFLEKMYDRFSKAGQNIGFIWTGISKIQDSDSGEEISYAKIWPEHFSSKEFGLIEATSIGNGYGICVRKKCIDLIGLYDETIVMGHDTEFLFRLARNFDFETISEVLVKIHQHGLSQLTNEKNNIVRLELREKILEKNLDLLYRYPKLYYIHYKVIVNLCYSLKLKRKGRRTMLSIIKYTPFRFLNFIDLLLYELIGKASIDFYYHSRLNKLVNFMKK